MRSAGAEPPSAGPPGAEPVELGVPLRSYAAVVAALSEGITLEDALASEGLDAPSWWAVDKAWNDRLLDDAAGDGDLVAAFDERLVEARARFVRRVPPLDDDLRAWLDFFRAMSAASDPSAWLERFGLRLNDVFRLQTAWGERLAADERLRKQSEKILSAPPGEPPVPKPERLRMAAAAPAPVAPKAAPPRLPSLSAPLPSPGAPEEPAAERPPPVAPPPQVPVAPATPLAPPASPPRAPPREVREVRPPSPARLDVTSDAAAHPRAACLSVRGDRSVPP